MNGGTSVWKPKEIVRIKLGSLNMIIEECFGWRYELGTEFQTNSKIIFTNKEPIYLEIVKLPNSNYFHYGTAEIKYGDIGVIQQRCIIDNDNETIYIKLENETIVFMSYKIPKIKLIPNEVDQL